VKTAAVITEPKRANGRTRFTLYWAQSPRGDSKDPRPVAEQWRRAQCFDAVLEEHMARNPEIRIVENEEAAWVYVRPG